MSRYLPPWLVGGRFGAAGSSFAPASGLAAIRQAFPPSRRFGENETLSLSPPLRAASSLTFKRFGGENKSIQMRHGSSYHPGSISTGLRTRIDSGRYLHTSRPLLRRSYSSNVPNKKETQMRPAAEENSNAGKPKSDGVTPSAEDLSKKESHAESLAASVSKYLHLPKMPHRPTKEELLAAANGFWERLRVRFKWMSIRSMRPWNADEWGAFVSWFLFGHLVWILVGTTTFFSLLILSINTVFAQGTP